MYSFRNDYSEGAHPQVLQALTDTNLVQTCGYGVDPICEEARDLIRTVCAAPEADVHFLVGGTQTNLTVITALLASYEAVIAAHTGHVNCHETGAIEATGHKVCVETSPDGKVTPAMVEAVLARHDGSEHMVSPKMVYISDTTEIGTVYTKAELIALRHCCDEHGLLLFLDGARLGSALTSPESDLNLPELKRMELARALATNPSLLLLDEVMAGLNPTDCQGVVDLILKIRDTGMSIILIEHVMKAVMSLSDRVYVLNQGALISQGTVEEVTNDPAVISSYLGEKKSAET